MSGTIITVVVLVVIVLLLLVLGIGYGLAHYITHPMRISIEQGLESERKRDNLGDYLELEKEDYIMTMRDGYEIHAQYIPAKVPSKKFMILTHGYTYNRIGAVKYLPIFRDMDFNCIIYDDRAHGLNAPFVCSMGLEEHKDLLEIISQTYKRFGGDITLGLHGESMGAATTTYALGDKPDVAFAVIDCGYADLLSVAKHKVKQWFHLPGFLCYPASRICRMLYGFSLAEVRPIEALKDCQIPICFMHGRDDDFISYHHSERMHAVTKELSELHLFPGADHALSFDSDKEGYTKIVQEFINKVFDEEGY